MKSAVEAEEQFYLLSRLCGHQGTVLLYQGGRHISVAKLAGLAQAERDAATGRRGKTTRD